MFFKAQIKRVNYDVDNFDAIGEAVYSTSQCFTNCQEKYDCIFVRYVYFDKYPYCFYVRSYNGTKVPTEFGEFGIVKGNFKEHILLKLKTICFLLVK